MMNYHREISQVKPHSFFDSDEYRLKSRIIFKGDVLPTTGSKQIQSPISKNFIPFFYLNNLKIYDTSGI